jgi:PAS domain S-box-containing protein
MNGDDVDPPSGGGGWLGAGTLAQSSERYASMFVHHPLAAYSIDALGFFTDANPLPIAMTGLSLEEMRGTHFSQVIHPDDRDLIQGGFVRALAGEPQVLEARVLRVDGEVVDIRCTAIPVVVEDRVVGVHGVTEDVTEAKRVLRELEEANAAKTLFLATVSHEVRTPLAVLAGATELLMECRLEAEPAHYAQMVHRSTERLMRLVDDILEFSGLEEHQTVLHPRPFDVRELVEDLRSWAEPLAESRDLAIAFDVDKAVPATLVGDCRRVSQVLTNLVHNAVKFTEQGDVEVSFDCDGVEPGWLRVTVADSGIGIPQEHLQSLFEPFTQVSPHVAGDRQGIGLGLTISRHLVELMGGQLRAVSRLGEGSTFTLRLPLRAR